jgi:flagellar biosynthetic protein FlhB
MPDNSARTEKATPHRLKKARKEGQFPVAREFVSAVQFFAYVALAGAYFPNWIASVKAAVRMGLRQAFSDGLSPAALTSGDLILMMLRLSDAVLRPLAYLGLAMLAVTIFFQMVSTNMGFSFARLAPNFNRLNVVQRLKDLPGNNLWAFFQAIVMIPVIFWLTWSLVRNRLPDLLHLPLLPIASAASMAGFLLKDVLRKAAFVLILLGVVMLVRERARYSRRMRMTKEDIREEYKETEGNPQTKARVRRIQRDLRRRSMMKDVAKATAVVVNPTHYAVALKYEQGIMAAPQVIAKGKNYLAARIRQRAVENQVPIIENPPLAQALYKSVEIGQEIPAHLYRAVAEILAYIFKLMAKNR